MKAVRGLNFGFYGIAKVFFEFGKERNVAPGKTINGLSIVSHAKEFAGRIPLFDRPDQLIASD